MTPRAATTSIASSSAGTAGKRRLLQLLEATPRGRCLVYASLIYENRSLAPLLQSTGMGVRYSEARDGHNWENWRDRMRSGLSWIFPGPLWLVYD